MSRAHRVWRQSPLWFEREAWQAISRRRFLIIPGRKDTDVYMVRMWLRDPAVVRGSFESGNEIMLHWFARGDDDQSLHDHPWSDFRTSILQGGYAEHLPPLDWEPGSYMGPAWDENVIERVAGDSIQHRGEDLHCVGAVRPNTFTLVRTGHRCRPWGFHPPGQPWIPYRDFLGIPSTEQEVL